MSFSFRRDRFRIDDEAWLVLILVFVVTTGYGPLNSGASYRAFRYTNRTRTVPPSLHRLENQSRTNNVVFQPTATGSAFIVVVDRPTGY